MGIGKGKSDRIDIDGLMGNTGNEDQAAQEENGLSQKIEELKKARIALSAAAEKLEEATREMSKATLALDTAGQNADNIVTGISRAIVDAQQNTVFTARLHKEDLDIFRELYVQLVKDELDTLQAHRDKQDECMKQHEKRIGRILRHHEGIWLSDRWMKILAVSLSLYNVIMFLYCLLEK